MIGPPGNWWNEGSAAIEKTLKRAKMPRRITPDRRMGIPYEAFDLTTSDDVRLAAWFVPAPEGHERGGGMTVVLHHHYGGQRATLLHWIDFFHELGLPTLCFDARGHAASDSAPPGRGSFVRRSEDVRAACDEARRRGATKLLGFGQSQGSAALVISMAVREDVVGVIVESGPAPDMLTAAWGLAGNMLGAVDSRHLGRRALLALRILPGTHPLLYLWRLWKSLARLRGVPLLWLHGGRDSVISARWSGWWFGWLRPSGGDWSAVHIETAEHVQTLQEGDEIVKRAVSGFIDQAGGGSSN